MQALLDLPDEVNVQLGVNKAEVEKALRRELALVFYSRGWLGAGRAADYGGMTRLEFEKLLTARDIVRPLEACDLAAEWSPT